jgi:putative transposase
MLRAQQFRLNPTPEQRAYFMQAAGTARFVYNWALHEYRAAKERGEKMNWNALQKRFNQIKVEECPWVLGVSKSVSQVAFADLRRSINTYYKAKKTNPNRLRFPGLRKRSRRIGGFGVQNDQFSISGNTVRLPRLGKVNISHPLRFTGKIMSGRVKEKAGRWYFIVVVECESQPVANASGAVGIDFGLSHFAVLSTEKVYENQVYFRRSERKLRLLQRGLARKKKGSNNRAKWKIRVARVQEHVANQRKDFIHKFTTEITQLFDVVCVEDLNLAGLHRTRLAKSFSDVAIGETVRQLSYKANWLQKVDRFFASSKLCHKCGWKKEDLKLSDRFWTCEGCWVTHDRDYNAAMNIKIEGIRLLAGTGYDPRNACGAKGLCDGVRSLVSPGCEAGRVWNSFP